jgi:hypothetical protein
MKTHSTPPGWREVLLTEVETMMGFSRRFCTLISSERALPVAGKMDKGTISPEALRQFMYSGAT